jgi:hypothetical protein
MKITDDPKVHVISIRLSESENELIQSALSSTDNPAETARWMLRSGAAQILSGRKAGDDEHDQAA